MSAESKWLIDRLQTFAALWLKRHKLAAGVGHGQAAARCMVAMAAMGALLDLAWRLDAGGRLNGPVASAFAAVAARINDEGDRDLETMGKDFRKVKNQPPDLTAGEFNRGE